MRFAVVGAAAALLGWILLYLLVRVARLHYLVAFVVSFLIMNALAYLSAGRYAFRGKGTRDRAGLLRYYTISLVSLGCNGLALAFLVERMGLNYLVAAALLALANAPVNFLLHRRITYRIGATAVTQRDASPVRIAVVTHYFPAHGGGIETVAGRLAVELARSHGAVIDWLASDCDAVPALPSAAVNCVPVAAWNGIERRTGLPYPLWSLAGFGKLARAIARADAVHIHDFAYASSIAAAVLARMHRIPLVITQHTGAVRSSNRALSVLVGIAEQTAGRFVLASAAAVVCVGAATRAHFEGRLGGSGKFVTIWNGLDVGVLQAATLRSRRELRAAAGYAADTPIALFAGRLVRKKGIEIVRGVAAGTPHVQFLIAGRGPVDPRTWGLPNVRVLGQVDAERMVELYGLADLLLLPSYCEGFPLVVQEALACGTGVLSTDEVAQACPPVAALIRHCPVPRDDDPGAWIAAMRDVLADGAYLANREARAQCAARTWSWDRCADAYIHVFAHVVRR